MLEVAAKIPVKGEKRGRKFMARFVPGGPPRWPKVTVESVRGILEDIDQVEPIRQRRIYFRLPNWLALVILTMFGFILYGVPKGFVSAQTYPQLYGLQYISLFTFVLIYGKGTAVLLNLLLMFLRVLLNGISFREITSTGVPFERFTNNLIRAQNNFSFYMYEIIVVTCFILLFSFFFNLINSWKRDKTTLVLPISHLLAITFCSWGLTMYHTRQVNLAITGITLQSVLLIIVGSLGVFLLKYFWKKYCI